MFFSACFVVFSVSLSLSLSLVGQQRNFRRRCLPLCRLHPAQRQTHYRALRSRPRCLHGLRFVAPRGTAFAPRKIYSRGAYKKYKRPEHTERRTQSVTLVRCAQILEIQSTHRGRSAAAAVFEIVGFSHILRSSATLSLLCLVPPPPAPSSTAAVCACIVCSRLSSSCSR